MPYEGRGGCGGGPVFYEGINKTSGGKGDVGRGRRKSF